LAIQEGRYKLGKKLLSGLGAMLALVFLTSDEALVVTRNLNEDLRRAANVTARKQYLAGEVSAATAEMASCERGNVLADMLSDKAQTKQYQQSFRARAAGLLEGLGRVEPISGRRRDRLDWALRRNPTTCPKV
jgi:hypothetical protein